jgi:hypothetical protein
VLGNILIGSGVQRVRVINVSFEVGHV